MNARSIRVFRTDEGTVIDWDINNRSDPIGRIENPGAGLFIDKEFKSLDEARKFCEAEVERNSKRPLLLMLGDDILQEITSHENWQVRQRQSDLRYGAISTVVVFIIATVGFLITSPFQAVYVNLILAAVATLLYLVMLWIFGLGNVEAAVAVTILLISAFLIISAYKHHRSRHEEKPRVALRLYLQEAQNPRFLCC